jgi:hypothetical protein
MRYYDISGRVNVFSLARDVAPTTPQTAMIISAGSDAANPSTASMGSVDRTGYYSYIVHVVVANTLNANSDTMKLGVKLQSSTLNDTAAHFTSGVADVTSMLSADRNYKKLYLQSTGTAAAYNQVGSTANPAGFQDQQTAASPFAIATSYTWTGDGSHTPTPPVVLDARIFGTLRDANVVGKYIAPWVEVKGSASDTIAVNVNLILGAGDTMPVMEGGTAGTDNYYSKGQ